MKPLKIKLATFHYWCGIYCWVYLQKDNKEFRRSPKNIEVGNIVRIPLSNRLEFMYEPYRNNRYWKII
jgi:hypothetical protein